MRIMRHEDEKIIRKLSRITDYVRAGVAKQKR